MQEIETKVRRALGIAGSPELTVIEGGEGQMQPQKKERAAK